jgi:F0F1-type ATP synthase delta subunit
MRIKPSQYAVALEALSREGLNVTEIVRNFLRLLKRRGELSSVKAVMKALEKQEQASALKQEVVAVTAVEPVAMLHRVDQNVLGGVRFRTDDALYDDTVLARFEALKKEVIP